MGILYSLMKAEDEGAIEPLDWFELLPKEKIRDIPGYEDLYQVTSFGRVWSINKQIWLKEYLDKGNYPQVTLCKNKVHKTCNIHYLVLISFDRSPKWYEVCRHLDGNPRNNHILNLKWGTHKENAEDRVDHHGKNSCENNVCSYLTNVKVKEIRNKYSTGKYTQVQLAKEYGVTNQNIYYIVHNKTWKDVQ